eukprot:4474792-Pyramimonas_sp.AAC.1
MLRDPQWMLRAPQWMLRATLRDSSTLRRFLGVYIGECFGGESNSPVGNGPFKCSTDSSQLWPFFSARKMRGELNFPVVEWLKQGLNGRVEPYLGGGVGGGAVGLGAVGSHVFIHQPHVGHVNGRLQVVGKLEVHAHLRTSSTNPSQSKSINGDQSQSTAIKVNRRRSKSIDVLAPSDYYTTT